MLEARLAVGSVGVTPKRARGAEQALVGTDALAPSTDQLDAAAEAAALEAEPVADSNGSVEYKRQLVRVLTGRCVSEALAVAARQAGLTAQPRHRSRLGAAPIALLGAPLPGRNALRATTSPRAESFGTVADLYDRARPSYPPALVDALLVDGARGVLDVGCGTGKAGALLAARGCIVLGVEVDARMAAVARGKGLAVEVAAFERWKPAGRHFDLVISAQAWHWIEPRVGAAKASLLLAEGGSIGVFWNFGDPPAHVRERIAPIYARLAPALENYSIVLGSHHAHVEETLAGIAATGRFGSPETRSFAWSQTHDTSGWLDHLSTHSDHQVLPPAQRERLLAAVGDAIDAVGGSFAMSYEAVLVSARRG